MEYESMRVWHGGISREVWSDERALGHAQQPCCTVVVSQSRGAWMMD